MSVVFSFWNEEDVLPELIGREYVTCVHPDERETARNCPHCHAFSRMSPTAAPGSAPP